MLRPCQTGGATSVCIGVGVGFSANTVAPYGGFMLQTAAAAAASGSVRKIQDEIRERSRTYRIRHRLTVIGSLSSAHCHRLAVVSSLSSAHCHRLAVIGSLSLAHCHRLTVISSLSSAHCHWLTVIGPLPLAHCHWLTVIGSVRPLSLAYCH